MKFSAQKIILLFCIIGIILFLGYYRDFVFVTINFILQARDYRAEYTLPPSLNFLDQFSYNVLMNFKWLLTVLFSMAYLLVALITLRILFNKRKYTRILVGVYAAVMLLSGLFMLVGYVFGDLSARMYEFARYLMGMAQSPVILMILIPAFKLSDQEPNNITK